MSQSHDEFLVLNPYSRPTIAMNVVKNGIFLNRFSFRMEDTNKEMSKSRLTVNHLRNFGMKTQNGPNT